MSYKKGLKHFESLGYSLCPNDKFMQKQIENKTIYVHFVGGNWLIENKQGNKRGILYDIYHLISSGKLW